LRRFASIAGNLEILEREFLALRKVRLRLIEKYRSLYEKDKGKRRAFDAASLLGFLEARYPQGLSWRKAEDNGTPFPPKIDATCSRALNQIGLDTPEKLDRFVKRADFRIRVRSFAASQGITAREVSHLALVQIAVVMRDYDAFVAHFPDFIEYAPLVRYGKKTRH
jgi:hypothetical protein